MTADPLVTHDRPRTNGRRGTSRLFVCVAATLAALVVWAVATFAGVRLETDAGPIAWWMFVAASLVASLAGWAVLEVMERRLPRAPRWWLVLAVVVLAASLLGPLASPGVSGGTRGWLTVTHLVVAACLVPGLLRTARH